jgi:phosphatidate cytidylyltransferase
VAAAGILLYGAPVTLVLLFSATWWSLALFEMLRYRDARAGWLASAPGRLISGYFVLVPAWIAPLWLHAHQPQGWRLVLFIMVLVWTADSGAYFVGRPWGKTKIAPHISPGKSLEGVFGGLTAVVLVAWLSGKFIWQFGTDKLWIWVALAAAVSLISVVGDLMESRFKRAAGVKDSGNLLPGHGGVLDRIDAFTAAAPFFVLGWLTLGLAT